jgi:hypothetical protein
MQLIEIQIKGQIDRDWSDWLDEAVTSHTNQGETVLTGRVRDQAALYGLLSRLSGLGLKLISLTSGETKYKNKEENNNEDVN